ncbi:MAG: methyltransferase domain-containing protein [Pseudomonadota bacterium]
MSETPFQTLHKGLLREAPGSDASTLKALTATGLAGPIRMVDMGCGPGAAALLALQALPEAEITAIDTHQPYLETLRTRADAAGLSARLETRCTDMATPGLPEASLDLILSEGALYFLGVEAGLKRWAPLLKPGGIVAFSEAIWIKRSPAEEAKLFWMDYPEMTNRAGVRQRIANAGYDLLEEFVLPLEDWHAYLGPLGARVEALRPGADEMMRQVLDGAEKETKLFERHGDSYAYAYFIAKRRL